MPFRQYKQHTTGGVGQYTIPVHIRQTRVPFQVSITHVQRNQFLHLSINPLPLPINVTVGNPGSASVLVDDDWKCTIIFGAHRQFNLCRLIHVSKCYIMLIILLRQFLHNASIALSATIRFKATKHLSLMLKWITNWNVKDMPKSMTNYGAYIFLS